MKSGLSEKVSEETTYLFFYTINRINEELKLNGLYNVNHVLLSVSSFLSKNLLLKKDKIFEKVINEVHSVLLNSSITYRNIYDCKYNNILSNVYMKDYINMYIREILNYYVNLMEFNQDKFDSYISMESKMPKDSILRKENLFMSIDDIQNTMNLLNEAVRNYYEIYHKKILVTEFTDEQIIEFKIMESQLAHLLGLNLQKIVTNPNYVNIFKITEDEIECILDPSKDPDRSAAVSILHKIVDISDGNLLTFEYDRLKKLSNYSFRYVEYDSDRLNLLNYSKMNLKSKAFIKYNPLEELSLILNFPVGYELIYSRKKRVERGEVLPAQHSLLLSKNNLSELYKYSSLMTNYDPNEDRRYFMSLYLRVPEEVIEFQQVAQPAVSTRVMIEGEDGSGGFAREFSREEQLRFLGGVSMDLPSLTCVAEYFKKMNNNSSFKKTK